MQNAARAKQLRPAKRLPACAAALVLAALVVISVAAPSGAAVRNGNPLLGPFPTKKVTLTVWDTAYFPGQPAGNALKKIDALFMKHHPNVTIKHVGFPFGAYWPTKVQVAIASKSGPDVLATYPNSNFYKGLWPLKSLISPAQKRSMLWFGWDFQDPSMHQIPWTTYAYFFVYNKALFAQAGLNPNTPPTTLSQLTAACGKLKAAGITPIAAGFKDGWYGEWFNTYGLASRYFSQPDLRGWYRGDVSWQSPQMRKGIDALLQLKNAGCFADGSEGKSLSDVEPDFAGKRAAMYYASGAVFADLRKAVGSKNVGIFRLPKLPGQAYPGQPVDSGANNGYGITRFTKNCRVAWAYLSEAVMGAKAQKILYEATNAYPNNTRVNATPNDPLDGTILKWLKDPTTHTGPAELGAQETTAALKGYPQLISGQMNADQFLKSVQDARQGETISHPTPDPTPPCR